MTFFPVLKRSIQKLRLMLPDKIEGKGSWLYFEVVYYLSLLLVWQKGFICFAAIVLWSKKDPYFMDPFCKNLIKADKGLVIYLMSVLFFISWFIWTPIHHISIFHVHEFFSQYHPRICIHTFFDDAIALILLYRPYHTVNYHVKEFFCQTWFRNTIPHISYR